LGDAGAALLNYFEDGKFNFDDVATVEKNIRQAA
jgi:hypothetical protein